MRTCFSPRTRPMARMTSQRIAQGRTFRMSYSQTFPMRFPPYARSWKERRHPRIGSKLDEHRCIIDLRSIYGERCLIISSGPPQLVIVAIELGRILLYLIHEWSWSNRSALPQTLTLTCTFATVIYFPCLVRGKRERAG